MWCMLNESGLPARARQHDIDWVVPPPDHLAQSFSHRHHRVAFSPDGKLIASARIASNVAFVCEATSLKRTTVLFGKEPGRQNSSLRRLGDPIAPLAIAGSAGARVTVAFTLVLSDRLNEAATDLRPRLPGDALPIAGLIKRSNARNRKDEVVHDGTFQRDVESGFHMLTHARSARGLKSASNESKRMVMFVFDRKHVVLEVRQSIATACDRYQVSYGALLEQLTTLGSREVGGHKDCTA